MQRCSRKMKQLIYSQSPPMDFQRSLPTMRYSSTENIMDYLPVREYVSTMSRRVEAWISSPERSQALSQRSNMAKNLCYILAILRHDVTGDMLGITSWQCGKCSKCPLQGTT